MLSQCYLFLNWILSHPRSLLSLTTVSLSQRGHQCHTQWQIKKLGPSKRDCPQLVGGGVSLEKGCGHAQTGRPLELPHLWTTAPNPHTPSSLLLSEATAQLASMWNIAQHPFIYFPTSVSYKGHSTVLKGFPDLFSQLQFNHSHKITA